MTLILENKPISKLFSSELIDVQTALVKLGFLGGGQIDGVFGPMTLKAWSDWKISVGLGQAEYLTWIGPASWKLLQEQAATVKKRIHNFATKQGTIDAIRYECNAHGLTLKTQHAYVLATTDHETAGSFKPVEEGYYLKGDKVKRHQKSLRYYPYYGRGYVQLTWKSNYAKYSEILGVDLVNNPAMACDPNIALYVLCHGFANGTFTGRRLSTYVNSQKTDFLNARRCINGMDRAAQIADLAHRYLRGLK